ncbi:MAG: TetR/AcrR family transcriptional regulator [Rhizobiaceae bacterium]|nr:TetR/AcrR family transcriptional regulator [Rhizobiaceae bacterium]MCV0408119.1 TetR/AcrR family transcriptional regulator [Rhizobiaceae bacterium]
MNATSRGSPQARLTRERIVAEASRIVLSEGADALSMRDLAGRLGVSAMALYNHVGDKGDLVRAVTSSALRDLKLPRAEDWREQLRLVFRAVRDRCVENPALPRLIERADLREPKLFEPMEVALAALAKAGLTGADALRAYFLLIGFTMGHVAYLIGGPFRALDLSRAISEGKLNPVAFPLTVEVAASAADWNFETAFEFGLDTIIAGLERGRD